MINSRRDRRLWSGMIKVTQQRQEVGEVGGRREEEEMRNHISLCQAAQT